VVNWAFRYPYTVAVLALAILALGLTTLGRIPVDILPQFRTPAVQILTLYPGMPSDIVERDITNRLERWTSQANGVARQESRSLSGVSVVRDYFREDIDPNTAMSQVSALAISDLYYLPPGTVPPMVMPFDPTASLPLCLLAVSSESLDETEIYDIAYFQIRNQLSGISGVIAPAVYGGRLRRIYAYADRHKLMARNLSLMDVVEALREQNVFIPTGNAKIGDYDYQVESNGMVEKVQDMADIPIRMVDGRPILLKDVAEIKDSFAIQTNLVRINGKRAVYLPVYRQPGANTIAVVDGIRKALPGILERVSQGDKLKTEVIIDQSIFVRKAIAGLSQEALIGVGLAAIMVLAFLGSWRATAITLVCLPVALLVAVMALYGGGHTLNSMTLGGFALAIGMLMDNTIVVLENTSRHLSLGATPETAAQVGANEVASPILVATLVLCVVFVPVFLMTGMGRFLFTPLALAVVLALFASYLLSLTLVPLLCARHFVHTERPPLLEGFLNAVQSAYQRSLGWALARRPLVLLAIIAGLVGSSALLPWLGQELFPSIDSGQLVVSMRAPTGSRVEKTEKLAIEMEAQIRQLIPAADLKMVVANIGILYDWPAAYTPNAGPHDAFVLVQLQPGARRSAADYVKILRRQLPLRLAGVSLSFDSGGLISTALNMGLPSPINVQVEGPSLEVAREIAKTVQSHLAQIPGAVDVRIQQDLDYPQLKLDIDRFKAAQLGLSAQEVVQNVVSALSSSVTFLPSFWLDHKTGNHYFLGVTYKEDDIRSRDSLADVPLTGKFPGPAQSVRGVATLSSGTLPAEVNHLNIRRVTDVFANVQDRDVGAVAQEVARILERMRGGLPAGYSVNLRGEYKLMRDSFAGLQSGLVLSVLLVYLVMVAQFRSFVDPFIILLAVPSGLIGVVWMLFLSQTSLSIPALMGAIMTVGLSVAYSILVVDFAKNLETTGLAPREAVEQAASIRLRPILMTSVAAILGLVPMALRTGEANMPLARAVIGGLSVSFIIKLYLVPVLYSYFRKAHAPKPS
jgi:multidrug efflux pump subunit AcrB